MLNLEARSATTNLGNRIEDIVGTFPKSDGVGTFKFGIRISRRDDGTFDLVTLLTRQ